MIYKIYATISQLRTEQTSTVFDFVDIYEVEATKASFQMQLKLALAWNRIDVAKSEIFGTNLQENKFEVK